MLGPYDRRLVADALHPPPGSVTEAAVGGTFSLNLDAVLSASVALAGFDLGAKDEDPDPLAVMEAVQRGAGRLFIAYQAGRISVPKKYRPIACYLEDAIVAVTAPGGFQFHPKFWVLRFADAATGRHTWRVVCLSRNLTLDRSLDTVLVLDGAQADGRDPTIARLNEPLVRLLRSLPGLAVSGRGVDSSRRMLVRQLAAEIGQVKFVAPPGTELTAFHTLGIGRHDWPFPHYTEATLAVAPFLSAGMLARLPGPTTSRYLVSTSAALDALPAAEFESFAKVFILIPSLSAGEREDSDSPAQTPSNPEAAALAGLHAKFYVCDQGTTTRLVIGSANATAAAFGGNVEFCVSLIAPRRAHGVASMLDGCRDGLSSFGDMLVEYVRPQEMPEPDAAEQALEAALDRCVRAVATAIWTVDVLADESDYEAQIDTPPLGAAGEAKITARAWPASVPSTLGQALHPGGSRLRFGGLPKESITSFVVINLQLEMEGCTKEASFVVNALLTGSPADRKEHIFGQQLGTARDVLRYLLFLLSGSEIETGSDVDPSRLMARLDRTSSNSPDAADLPLFETLLRLLARDPARLNRLDRLISNLQESSHGSAKLPGGLLEVWVALKSVIGAEAAT